MTALSKALEQWRVDLLPLTEELVHGVIERSELCVLQYRRLHISDRELQLAVARAVRFLEQRLAHGRDDLPVAVECIYVAFRDTAAQMAVNVLQIFRLGAVDVSRKIEVVVVLRVANFRDRHETRVARKFDLPREYVDYFVDVLLTK